jgi:ribosome-associated toxin RatA of RatAB toxin-antitoxin module
VFGRIFRTPISLVTPLLLFLSLSVFTPSIVFNVAMHTGNSIIIHAPKSMIFETAANLELWPKILPHYRYIRYLERGADRNLVVMAATRLGLPIAWTSEQIIDRKRGEVRFHHLKAWTKGMDVVWTFRETPAGVVVEILHDLRFSIPLLAPIAEPIISKVFIHPVASKTLRCMKTYLESRATAVLQPQVQNG